MHTAMMSAARSAAGAVVPEAPSGLEVIQLSPTSLGLTWTDESTNEDNFVIYRSVDGGSFSQLTTKSANVEQHDDTGLTEGKEYTYEVAAKNEQGESDRAGPVSKTPLPDVPDAPSDFSLSTFSDTELDATWTDNSDNEDGFRVIDTNDNSVVASVGANAESVRVSDLDPASGYALYVEAFNTAGSSGSFIDTATTKIETPVLDHTVTGEGETFEFITLDWTEATGASEYEIFKDGSLHTTTSDTSRDVTCDDATGAWKVRGRASGIPDSDFSNVVNHTCG